MIRKANAVWRGGGREGAGELTSASGVLSSTPYGYRSRFEDGPGTNPEELIAAAHAGCFAMALAFGLERAGIAAEELQAEAAITLEAEGEGFRISRSALTLTARVTGVEEARFQELAQEAKANCPVSKLLNAEITLDARLES